MVYIIEEYQPPMQRQLIGFDRKQWKRVDHWVWHYKDLALASIDIHLQENPHSWYRLRQVNIPNRCKKIVLSKRQTAYLKIQTFRSTYR